MISIQDEVRFNFRRIFEALQQTCILFCASMKFVVVYINLLKSTMFEFSREFAKISSFFLELLSGLLLLTKMA